MKLCSKCGTSRALAEFNKDRSKRDGLHSICKHCHRANDHRWRAIPENRAADRAASRAWRQANRAKSAWTVRNATLKAKYGLRISDYDRIHAAQGGGCAICGAKDSKVGHGLHVDHDHVSGKVRGLLCQPCNTSLGKMDDCPARLRKAALYLERGGLSNF